MSHTLSVQYPESLPTALHMSRAEFEREARFAMAAKLFETGKLTLTAALGGLDLLPTLYGRVLVPVEVQRELASGADRDDAARRLIGVSGIEIPTRAADIRPLLAAELDLGEAAVIALALDLPGATVVLDDLKARRVAHRHGIALTGSLGVLLYAKRLGKLHSVAEAVERIRRHGAWLSDALVDCALILAGEKP